MKRNSLSLLILYWVFSMKVRLKLRRRKLSENLHCKSLTWHGYDILVIWPKLGTVNSYRYVFGTVRRPTRIVCCGHGHLWWANSRKSTNHGLQHSPGMPLHVVQRNRWKKNMAGDKSAYVNFSDRSYETQITTYIYCSTKTAKRSSGTNY